MTTATLTSKYQIHIPKEIREIAGFLQHGQVRIIAKRGVVTILPQRKKDILSFAGTFRVKKPISAEKIREHIAYTR